MMGRFRELRRIPRSNGASASHKTAAKVLDVVSRLPGWFWDKQVMP